MKQIDSKQCLAQQGRTADALSEAVENHVPILTRFGDAVDVRRRGALRIGRFAGTQARTLDTPAVVRIWSDDQCRELSAHQARALAAQLLDAALLADSQNGH